ncbi:auxin response factor 17-like [Vicia villosa]|uniref:auxin response factor 17-like n=1 Tax=Vicia villosa TaxID=3911 RepID=UPI00273B978E|nr:auxin response factor 17-like [Vicia villosa]
MVQQQLLHRVDPKIWQQCAGDSVTVLKLNSKLYYFPRGHLEHACPNYPSTQALSLIDACRPSILCVVSSVDLFADSKTDELVAKLLLTPVIDGGVLPSQAGDIDEDDDQIVSYAKTLTQSDANNGGAFSIPVKCAKFIFPPLDYNTESPSQIVSVTDFHGKVWNFRHVYSGTPKRHLITNGWSTFSNDKKLVGGDTVVFVKNLTGNITIGLRRRNRSAAAANISEKAVIKAVELAEKNAAFEVMYYPTVGGFDFVVGTKAVEDARKISWNPGMSVKYTAKTNGDNSKGCSIFHGTISSIAPPCISPWRMLQVNWNESTVFGNLGKVSPWQVEIISNKPIVHLRSPPTKKLRVSLSDDSSSDSNNKEVTYSSIMLFGKRIIGVRNT